MAGGKREERRRKPQHRTVTPIISHPSSAPPPLSSYPDRARTQSIRPSLINPTGRWLVSIPFHSIRLGLLPWRAEPNRASEARGAVWLGALRAMAAGGGGSASRVGDGDVDLGAGWDWRTIPQLLSSACIFLCCGGCFGCCDKTVRRVGELSKSLLSQDQNPTIGEEFCSTSTIEIEPADLRGVSSINTCYTSTWALDQHGPVGGSHSPPEFVNHGLFLWKQNRQEWIDNRRQQPKVNQIREPILSWNAAYESLFGSNKPFPQPVPLHEMVDFLVDIWEQEGLYD